MPISRLEAEEFASALNDRTILTTRQIYKTLLSPPYRISGSSLPTFNKVITSTRLRNPTPLTDDELLDLQTDIIKLSRPVGGRRRRGRKTQRHRRSQTRRR